MISPRISFALLLMLTPAVLAQQPTTNPALQHARELFAKENWRGALDAYEKLHSDEPKVFQYVVRIGISRLKLHEYPQAIEAFEEAIKLGAPEAFARYNLACASARLGKPDDAMKNLARANELGFVRPGAVEADEDLASLRADSRYIELLDKMKHPTRGMKGAKAMDHWIGEWDVFMSGQLVGRSSITRTLDGYGVEEHWLAVQSGGRGQSFFTFDPVKGNWHQLWVDDRGWRVEKIGTPIDNGIQLEGTSFQADGTNSKSREFLTKNPDGTVRQLLEGWDEPSKSWQVQFDGKYVRRK